MFHLSAVRKTYLVIGTAIAAILLVLVLLLNTENIPARWFNYRGFDGLGPTKYHEDTFDANQSMTITVENETRGGVQITGEQRDTVLVETRIERADRVKYEVDRVGDEIRVSAFPKQDKVPWGNALIRITVPESVQRIVVDSPYTDIRVKNIVGNVDLTSRFYIYVNDFSGEMVARHPPVGSKGVQGYNIRVFVDSMDTKMNGANIEFNGDFVTGSINEMQSYAADFDIEFVSAPSIVLDAQSVNGTIRKPYPIEVTSSGDNYLRGTIGTGETKLTIRSEHGDILLPSPDCDDFQTSEEANAYYFAAGGPDRDPHGLDRDRDGVPCEAFEESPSRMPDS